ncbi:MAG: bifunctional 5,10-methylenetetrahydrofolate dehydrogenase/5,10-methenyltetrahydrofolate cyclohydrolase [Caldilineaceae bacterium]|nr:bifunctional 5,10-methylenetetrahydrofolate dehydrogenase/5,10-methenyltetrahydrofolate cyclohydrolase [Caldilineaceae bacterium]MBP9074811.1 bifunctional 5,10-methylenetetrahydrofolate dehydrogenase/5,10-methenyltetrahydrofolate cyclohydrolase [Caldilineaceae bacterium]
MSAHLLDGKNLSKEIKNRVKTEVTAFTAAHSVTPTLAVVLIGDDGGAAGYARAIEKNCASVSMAFRGVELGADTTQAQAAAAVNALNDDPTIHGIMVLEPVPAQVDLDVLVLSIAPTKDVDGVNPINAGRLSAQRPPFFVPATPLGGVALMEAAGVEFKGKRVVMLGRSDIVGKPMAMLMLHRHATVTIAHSRTVDLPARCREADILCVAIGRPEMVKADWVKPGAVVVDFGTTYTDDGLKGDCDQAAIAEVAGMLTPVPGGTGPVTNAMLMANVLEAAKLAVG